MKSWWLAPAETRSRFIRPGRKGPKTGPKGQSGPKTGPRGTSYEALAAATCGNEGPTSYDPARTGRNGHQSSRRMKSHQQRPAETQGPLHTARLERPENGSEGHVV